MESYAPVLFQYGSAYGSKLFPAESASLPNVVIVPYKAVRNRIWPSVFLWKREKTRSAATDNWLYSSYGKQISLSDLADTACLSPNYFCRIFKSETGLNYTEYLSKYRLLISSVSIMTALLHGVNPANCVLHPAISAEQVLTGMAPGTMTIAPTAP